MNYRKLLPLSLLLLALTPVSARADVNSCTQQLIESKTVFSPWAFTGGDHAAKTEYEGANYHLIYLIDEAGRETTVVVKENESTCEAAYYNPTGSGPEANEVLPAPVFKVFEPVGKARNEARAKREEAERPSIVEEYKRRQTTTR